MEENQTTASRPPSWQDRFGAWKHQFRTFFSMPWKDKVRLRKISVILGAGLFGGFLLGVCWNVLFNPYKQRWQESEAKAKKTARALQTQLDQTRLEFTHVQQGAQQMNRIFNQFRLGWENPPQKPEFLRVNSSAMLFWGDGEVSRRYFVYRAPGKSVTLRKVNEQPTNRMFYFIRNPRGKWRYAVTAVNRQGTETAMSEMLEVSF